MTATSVLATPYWSANSVTLSHWWYCGEALSWSASMCASSVASRAGLRLRTSCMCSMSLLPGSGVVATWPMALGCVLPVSVTSIDSSMAPASSWACGSAGGGGDARQPGGRKAAATATSPHPAKRRFTLRRFTLVEGFAAFTLRGLSCFKVGLLRFVRAEEVECPT